MEQLALNQAVLDYYRHYYGKDCSLPSFQAHAEGRLKEELREGVRLKAIEARWSASLQGKKHLVVGAGTGGLAVSLFKDFKSQVYGIEPHPSALSIIRKKCEVYGLPADHFLDAVAEEIPFPDETFDYVHCISVLEHVRDVRKSLQEMIRVLKPGGKLLLETPNYAFPYEGHYKIPFPTFLPRWLGQIFLITLGKSPRFLSSVKMVTERQIRKILLRVPNIEFEYRYISKLRYTGRFRPVLQWFFYNAAYPMQDITVTKLQSTEASASR